MKIMLMDLMVFLCLVLLTQTLGKGSAWILIESSFFKK